MLSLFLDTSRVSELKEYQAIEKELAYFLKKVLTEWDSFCDFVSEKDQDNSDLMISQCQQLLFENEADLNVNESFQTKKASFINVNREKRQYKHFENAHRLNQILYYETLCVLPLRTFSRLSEVFPREPSISSEKSTVKTTNTTSKTIVNSVELPSPLGAFFWNFRPYPKRPYFLEIVRALSLWGSSKQLPLRCEDLETLPSMKLTRLELERLDKITQEMVILYTRWLSLSDTEKILGLVSIIKKLKLRGLLTLLRVCKTEGSMNLFFPPSSLRLFQSFNHLHHEDGNLTVGARALAKHHFRCRSHWWCDDVTVSQRALIP